MDKEEYSIEAYEQWLNKLFSSYSPNTLMEYSYLPSLSSRELICENINKVGTVMREEDSITFVYAYKNWKKGKLNQQK